MTWNELKQKIIAEYNSKNLKSTTRYNAIDKVETLIKRYYPKTITEVKELSNIDKQYLKEQYIQQKKEISVEQKIA
ncbi:hypothetical protein [uncultured Bacteroides sp.]|uniref:hypothetical protein n=1 Tax=uncultured Bacteroides sp. TaxID=162156 RepID=UPI002605DCFC|nr:hypothetical protein [uncultured Bacteroides sp.]